MKTEKVIIVNESLLPIMLHEPTKEERRYFITYTSPFTDKRDFRISGACMYHPKSKVLKVFFTITNPKDKFHKRASYYMAYKSLTSNLKFIDQETNLYIGKMTEVSMDTAAPNQSDYSDLQTRKAVRTFLKQYLDDKLIDHLSKYNAKKLIFIDQLEKLLESERGEAERIQEIIDDHYLKIV